MSCIEICNKKDRSPGSFSHQIRLKNDAFGSVATDGNVNTQIFKPKCIFFVYHIIDFFSKFDILCHGIY